MCGCILRVFVHSLIRFLGAIAIANSKLEIPAVLLDKDYIQAREELVHSLSPTNGI